MKKITIVFFCLFVTLFTMCSALAAIRATGVSNSPQKDGSKRLPVIQFRDEVSFELKNAAADYARMDYATFLKTHDRFSLYKEGVIDAASYIIGDTKFENVAGGSTLVFSSRYSHPITGDIGIGSPISAIRDQFGEPDFTRRQDELFGYKTKTFYIAFTGKETVERIYLSRRYPQEEQGALLPEFYASGNPESFPFDKWNMASTQLWRSSMSYYSPGGLCIHDNYEDVYPITIYKDYSGQIPEGVNKSMELEFKDTDYPEYKIYAAIDEEKAIQKKLADGLEPGYYSPDKRIAILPFTDSTYERSGFLFRYLDYASPDQFLTFGHYPSLPLWINERYICVSSMYGFGIYDLFVEARDVFYIEDNSFGELEIVDPAQQSKTLNIRCEEITIHVGDMETSAKLDENEQLLLQFKFSADGALSVEHSIVSR